LVDVSAGIGGIDDERQYPIDVKLADVAWCMCIIGSMTRSRFARCRRVGPVRGLLAAFSLILPFEARLFRVGPLEITTVELGLYALAAAWVFVAGTRALRQGSAIAHAIADLRGDRLAGAVALWSLVVLASALAAPSYRGAAFKFALRSISGVVAFFAARDLANTPGVRRGLMLALVAGALASAATAAINFAAPSSAFLWQPFHSGDFQTFGLPRPSGVFGYPTIGAMYWEASVPLVVVVPLLGLTDTLDGPKARRAATVAVVGSIPLVWAILISATRSGLAGVAVACLTLLWLTWPSGPWVRGATCGVLVALLFSWGLALAWPEPGSIFSERLRWWHDDAWFRVEYLVDTFPRETHAGDVFTVPVTLRNLGTLKWPHGGEHPTHLAYHWEPLVGRDGTPPATPERGLQHKALEGSYRLQWDLVQEDVTWFSERGNMMPEQLVEVTAARAGTRLPVRTGALLPVAGPPPPPRAALWHAAVVLWRERPLLGIGPDNFRRRYGAVLSPAPTGQRYTDTRIHANNLYFETLADLGLAGAAALAWLAFALLRILRRQATAVDFAGLACSVGAGTFFIHGVLDYFFEFTPLFGLFWVLLGLSAASDLTDPSA